MFEYWVEINNFVVPKTKLKNLVFLVCSTFLRLIKLIIYENL